MTLRDSNHSIGKAAKILGIGRDTCMRAVESGQIPSIRIGKRRFIPDQVLKSLLVGAGPVTGASRDAVA